VCVCMYYNNEMFVITVQYIDVIVIVQCRPVAAVHICVCHPPDRVICVTLLDVFDIIRHNKSAAVQLMK